MCYERHITQQLIPREGNAFSALLFIFNEKSPLFFTQLTMKFHQILTFFIIFYGICAAFKNTIKINCDDIKSKTCRISAVKFTTSDFIPVSCDPENVTKFIISNECYFESSRFINTFCGSTKIIKVTRLTPHICRTFPNLEKIYLSNVSLTQIDEDALFYCKHLKEFHANDNLIKFLDENTFNGNSGLTVINLAGNPIESLDVNIFRGSDNLTYLYLEQILIKLVDIRKLCDELPKLKWLRVGGRSLECERFKQISEERRLFTVFDADYTSSSKKIDEIEKNMMIEVPNLYEFYKFYIYIGVIIVIFALITMIFCIACFLCERCGKNYLKMKKKVCIYL